MIGLSERPFGMAEHDKNSSPLTQVATSAAGGFGVRHAQILPAR